MKIKTTIQFVLLLSVLLLNHFKSVSQNTSKENEEIQSSLPTIEKIYLHTDRSYYNIGESLWYKAYSVYAYTNVLFDNSNLLYVELISPDSKIIARNITRLEQGLGHGDFKLTDSIGIKAGRYQLRAYTNWSRNFGDDFVFKKEIEIMDVFDQVTAEKNKKTKSEIKKARKNLDNETENTMSVQFFPEGGSLLEDVKSVIAFKAVDKNGLPMAVYGKVFDKKGTLIAMLKTVHDGMGKFQFQPVKDELYHAEISTAQGDQIVIPLPKANKRGYLLNIKKNKGKDIVTIKTNQKTLEEFPGEPLTIICTTKGVTYFEGTQPLSNTTLSFELPKDHFPNGTAQITLFDKDLRPQSERLVYIEKNNDLAIEVTTDKKLYKTKEKVIVNVSSRSKTGGVVPASFSLSSTDMNGVNEAKNYGMTISSYFLMESDIRGKVHNPGYYFDRSNSNRLVALDLLLLTQGWRDFLWKKLPQIVDNPAYKVEKGITISGSVKQLLGDKPKANSSVSMGIVNNGKSSLLVGVTDEKGRFKFNNLVFMGDATMMLNTQNENGKNRGMFELDSLHLPPMMVDFKNEGAEYVFKNDSIKQKVYEKHVQFGIAAENQLDEVLITAKKKTENRSKYGNADHTYIPDETPRSFADIYQLIQYSIPGVTVSGGTVGFNRYNGPALIVIDDVPTEQGDLDFVTPDDVAKIESLTSAGAAVFGTQGGNGVILIYTKEGSVGSKKNKSLHSIVKEIQGFYAGRIFYVPDYENPTLEIDNKAAIRNTLFWSPYVHPDENGDATVSYFNSEVNTNVKVTIEGITIEGIPVVVKTFYTIEK